MKEKLKKYNVILGLTVQASDEEEAIEYFCECLSRNEFSGNDITAEYIEEVEE